METERITGDETGDRKDIQETEGQDNDDHSEQGRVGAGAWGLQETDKMEKSEPRFYTGSESQEKSLSGPRSQSEAIRGKSSATAIWAETHARRHGDICGDRGFKISIPDQVIQLLLL